MVAATHKPRFRRSLLFAGLIALLAVILAIGLYLRLSAHGVSKPVKLSGLYWIYYREDLLRLQSADPAIVGQTLSGPGTYALEHNNAGPALPSGVTPVQLFFSYASFQSALSGNGILPGVRDVADDPENWPATPVNEQDDPLTYMHDFAKAASGKNLKTVLIPGRDLMSAPGATCGQQAGESISQAYVRCGLPSAAAWANIYVIQAASIETNLTALTQLVQNAAAAARAANPNVIIIATLSTVSNGVNVGAGTLNQAARAVLPYVQGFELNTTADTDARLLTFLHDLAGS